MSIVLDFQSIVRIAIINWMEAADSGVAVRKNNKQQLQKQRVLTRTTFKKKKHRAVARAKFEEEEPEETAEPSLLGAVT